MNRYRVVFRTAQGALRQFEHFWHEHPPLHEVISHARDAFDVYQQIEAVYHQWTDRNGNSGETRIH